jgi:signal peptidase I
MIRMTDYASTIDSTIAERKVASYKGNGPLFARYAKAVLGWLLAALGTSVILIVVVTFLSLTVPRIAGLNSYVVASGSMEPNYPVYSVVYADSTEASELSPGEVIIFNNPSRGSTPITHRIVSNDTANGVIITKGDANENADVDPVIYENVIGKVVMHVPYLGYSALLYSGMMGKVIAALMLIVSWFLIEIGRYLRTGEASDSQ